MLHFALLLRNETYCNAKRCWRFDRDQKGTFLPVVDSRKRKIRGRWIRNGRYHAQIRIDGGGGRTRAHWSLVSTGGARSRLWNVHNPSCLFVPVNQSDAATHASFLSSPLKAFGAPPSKASLNSKLPASPPIPSSARSPIYVANFGDLTPGKVASPKLMPCSGRCFSTVRMRRVTSCSARRPRCRLINDGTTRHGRVSRDTPSRVVGGTKVGPHCPGL